MNKLAGLAIPQRHIGTYNRSISTDVSMKSIPGGGALRPPFRFSCALAKRRKILSSYVVVFPSYLLRTFQ